ncbi:hypothetical protein L1887_16845 [Cichorium endivia]|nr:hypothetical protein L1887_16845 [Cichorium endivia]
MLQNISDMPRLEGIYNVKVSYVGGFHVLIEFDNEDLADDFLRKARPSWSNWFSNLAKWHRDFEIGKRLASISIYGVPLHVWNSEVFAEIARVWGEPVCLTNEDNSNLNKEVRRVGILTSEAPWINDFVKVNVQGRCYKVRVIEDPSRSMGMTPSDGNLDSDQSTNGDWFDLDDNQSEGVLLEKVDMNNDNCGVSDEKGGRVSASQHDPSVESSKDREKSKEQSFREVEKAVEKSKLRGNEGVNGNLLEVHKEPKVKNIEPNTFNPGDSPILEPASGPVRLDSGAPRVPNLNNSPNSSGVFPFLDTVEIEEEEYDLGVEDEIEQAISNEIERKRRSKRKGQKNSRIAKPSQKEKSLSVKSTSDCSNARWEEINQTIRIGEELGINFNGKRDLVEEAISRDGAIPFKC